MNDAFRKFSLKTSDLVGTSWAFLIALAVIVAWAITGPVFKYSDTWQLVINTGTTIVTFLMVFLIQNTQNRDAKAIHLKLDELLRSVEGARTRLVNLEGDSDEELAGLQKQFEHIQQHERQKIERASPQKLGDLDDDLEELQGDVRRARAAKEAGASRDGAGVAPRPH